MMMTVVKRVSYFFGPFAVDCDALRKIFRKNLWTLGIAQQAVRSRIDTGKS
jgi:hypothetical protein